MIDTEILSVLDSVSLVSETSRHLGAGSGSLVHTRKREQRHDDSRWLYHIFRTNCLC